MGSSTYSHVLVRSTQKLPMARASLRTSPRIRAIATVAPVAADMKFCQVKPAIWMRWLAPVSPA